MTWITAKEFAERVRCTKGNVTLGIKAGRVAPEFIRREGRSVLVNTAAVEDWMATGRQDRPKWPAAGDGFPIPRVPRRAKKAPTSNGPVMMWGKAAADAGAEEGEKTEREEIEERIGALRSDGSLERHEAERRIANLRLRLLELDVGEREGRLLDAEKACRRVGEVAKRYRDLLLGLPVRIGADLAATTTAGEAAATLEKAMVEALEGVADALQP